MGTFQVDPENKIVSFALFKLREIAFLDIRPEILTKNFINFLTGTICFIHSLNIKSSVEKSVQPELKKKDLRDFEKWNNGSDKVDNFFQYEQSS